ncbi:helix-turn-helix transcriptional regulator [Haloarchaeobius salinus]|uniref:helix-turn-helix transcriptional regulator n=1 Tax=Haloarchaeobius salinus TaxID=1198298 RepID=UPI00210D6156|nr:transcriptional regulator FilR1 domain-containing protein [Haloarchaeobius salinus]
MNQHEHEYLTVLNRVPVLEATRDRSVDRSTLQDELDISRATAYRRTSALTEEGLLEQTPTGYRATGAGCAAIDAAERFERSMAAIDRLQPLLSQLSAPELTRNIHRFADAELAVATPQNPSAPVEPWLEHFESFDRCRTLVVAGCPPAVTKLGVEHARNDVDFESICTPLALEADQNASEEAFDTIASAEAPSLYTHPGLPFTMGIIDDVVIVGGFDSETSLPVASVVTDDPDAREWAAELYRKYRRDAEPLDVPEAVA